MTEPTPYRRFDRSFTGTRPRLRLGDPGIDARWIKRRRWGAVVATGWFVLLPLGLGTGFMSHWGVFGQLDSWQLDTFGSGSVILLTLLFMPLMFVPHLVTRAATVDGSTPFLIGMRQAFDNDWGPRVEGPPGATSTFRTAQRVALGVAAIGAAVLTFAIWKGFRDAATPHAPLPDVTFAALVDPSAPLPDAARMVGVDADRSQQWSHDYRVRADTHHDVYYPLRPIGERADVPVALVELDQTSPQYEPKPWNSVDAPGPREGLPSVLGDWEAGELRRAGMTLAPRVIVLQRQQLDGRSPFPDPMDDLLYGMLGCVAMFTGSLCWWSFRRVERLRVARDTAA